MHFTSKLFAAALCCVLATPALAQQITGAGLSRDWGDDNESVTIGRLYCRVGIVLRLVETGVDGQSRSFDVMEIRRPESVGDIANLGLTLAEGKLLLAGVQQGVVAAQADSHATLRPDCRSCGRRCP